MKVLIIGGVAGGATAAARLRRLDEKAEIIVFEKGGYVSYANCGLPYYIGGVITRKEALTLQTPESFWARFRVQVRVHSEVSSIDPENKTVTVENLADGTRYQESYDKLILSPGARPLLPELPGIQDPRIFTLRTVEDTFRIREFMDAHAPRTALVVGGGYIGLEMAENLIHAGVETHLVQRSAHVLPPLDYDMACLVHSYLRGKGVKLHLSQTVESFSERDGRLCAALQGGGCIATDLVIMAVGVLPDTRLARDAGLALGAKGAIVVNDRMETSVADIYAVGDAVEIRHSVTGDPALVALAGPANKQGRIAADNICGRGARYRGAQGSSIIKLFDMTVASTGVNEAAAQAAGLSFDKAITYSASHASYYPGVSNMTIKTLFDPENGKLLGAQIVGFEGVDKRIDVLACAVRVGWTAQELTELDLAYAPSYSSAKDPVNMAGYVMENLLNGTVRQFHWYDVEHLPRDGSATLLDTRTAREYAQGHIDGTVNIPLDELRERLDELDPQNPVYVNCRSGLRSYIACRILTQNGFDCSHLSGGYQFYESVVQNAKFQEAPTHPCGVEIDASV